MQHFEDWECEWPLDKYAKEDIARRRYKNFYDNDFSQGNCECCFGSGTINVYCGWCYRVEQCLFKDGKIEIINCPMFVQFTSIGGKYLFEEFYIKER